MRQKVEVPQAVIDEHTAVAQTYAGYLVGHPIRAARYTTPLKGSVQIDWNTPWAEPNPMQDTCVFCLLLNDFSVEKRVAGFQAAIDKEVLATKRLYFDKWVAATGLPPFGDETQKHAAWRVFIREHQYKSIPAHQGQWGSWKPEKPGGWSTKAADLTSLPLRLKRKMVIGWNHCYTKWMEKEGLSYDFDAHEFYRDLDVSQEFHDAWMAEGA